MILHGTGQFLILAERCGIYLGANLLTYNATIDILDVTTRRDYVLYQICILFAVVAEWKNYKYCYTCSVLGAWKLSQPILPTVYNLMEDMMDQNLRSFPDFQVYICVLQIVHILENAHAQMKPTLIAKRGRYHLRPEQRAKYDAQYGVL